MKGSVRRKSITAAWIASLLLSACSQAAMPVSADVQKSAAMPAPECADPSEGADGDLLTITGQDLKTADEQAVEMDLSGMEGTLTITEGGAYLLYGGMEGQIVVDADEDELVHLYLSGVEITSPAGPALNAVSASKLIVTLVSDTENMLSDTGNYAGFEETKSCLYSVADLTINGDGKLSVYGHHEDGIRSKDRVRILGSRVAVQAKGDGIRGNDGILVKDGTLQIQSESNGLRTANQGAMPRGVIGISGGALEIISGKNGIYAASDLYLRDCSVSIYSVEEKIRSEGTSCIGEGLLD